MPLPRLLALCSLVVAWPASGQELASDKPLYARPFSYSPDGSVDVQAAAAELAKQTGLKIDTSAIDSNLLVKANYQRTGFWAVVDDLAKQTGSQVAIGRRGKQVSLIPSEWKGTPAASIDGPFRVAAGEVEARLDLSTGRTVYDLTLEVAWESSLPVYRLDSNPKISAGRADNGAVVTVKPIETRVPVSGTHATLRMRLDGLDRECKKIALLEGTFKATCAEEMLRFTFDDLEAPKPETLKGVTARLRGFTKKGNYWLADVDLDYPPGGATFESFETYWISRNRFTLVSPDGKERIATDDVEVNTPLRYRVKGFQPATLKGWKLEYEAPGPIREATVNFTLKNIPLP